jgi:hypothetical protein
MPDKKPAEAVVNGIFKVYNSTAIKGGRYRQFLLKSYALMIE